MYPGWQCVHVARGQGSAGIRVGEMELGSLRGCMEGWAPCLRWGRQGWKCWWLWMPLGKVLVLGHQKVSPT